MSATMTPPSRSRRGHQTRRGLLGLLTLALIAIASCGGAQPPAEDNLAKKRPGAPVARTARVLLAADLEDEIKVAAGNALTAVPSRATEALLGGHKPKLNEPSAEALNLLIVTAPPPGFADAAPVPAICRIHHGPLSVCRAGGDCTDLTAPSSKVILCNVDYIRRIPRVMQAIFRGDRSVLSEDRLAAAFLKRLRRDPRGVPLELDRDDKELWLSPIMMFLVFHEVRHLVMGSDPHAGFDAASSRPVTGERIPLSLRTLVICSNHRAFERQGWSMFDRVGDAEFTADLGSLGEGARAIFAESVSVWEAELDADAFAALRVTETIEAIKLVAPRFGERWKRYGEQTKDAMGLALLAMALDSWYGEIGRFIDATCPDLADARHLVSKCMCRDQANYRKIGMLFNETHPPFSLRMYNAMLSLDFIENQRLWRVVRFMMDQVGYMAYAGCTVDKWKRIFPNAAFGVDFPSLEGPWSKADAFREESRACARGAAPPSAAARPEGR